MNKKQLKSTLSYLKKAAKKHATGVFGYTDIQTFDGTDYQVFTDSYTLYALKEHVDELPLFKNTKEMNGKQYPNVTRFLNVKGEPEDIQVDIQKVRQAEKEQKHNFDNGRVIVMIVSDNHRVFVQARYLKTVYNILGNNLKVTLYGEMQPVLFENEAGDKALVLPVRVPITPKRYEDVTKEVE